jgi:hypothetical protein
MGVSLSDYVSTMPGDDEDSASFAIIVDAPGFSVVKDDGQVYYSYDSCRYERHAIKSSLKLMGYTISGSYLRPDMWEVGTLKEGVAVAKKENTSRRGGGALASLN